MGYHWEERGLKKYRLKREETIVWFLTRNWSTKGLMSWIRSLRTGMKLLLKSLTS